MNCRFKILGICMINFEFTTYVKNYCRISSIQRDYFSLPFSIIYLQRQSELAKIIYFTFGDFVLKFYVYL